MKWTLEKIAALTPSKRAQLYDNACNSGTPEGAALAQLIQESGLTLVDGSGITRDHPIVRGMEEIINSDEGRAACKAAVADGLPALAGVDPMLADAFPADYGKHNQTTDWAGHLVADAMRSMGFTKLEKQGRMPDGCVAQSAELWV